METVLLCLAGSGSNYESALLGKPTALLMFWRDLAGFCSPHHVVHTLHSAHSALWHFWFGCWRFAVFDAASTGLAKHCHWHTKNTEAMPVTYREHRGHANNREHRGHANDIQRTWRPCHCHGEHRGHANGREHRGHANDTENTEGMPITENTATMPVTYREHRSHANDIQRTQRPCQWQRTQTIPMSHRGHAHDREHRGCASDIQRTQRPYQWHTENTEANNSWQELCCLWADGVGLAFTCRWQKSVSGW